MLEKGVEEANFNQEKGQSQRRSTKAFLPPPYYAYFSSILKAEVKYLQGAFRWRRFLRGPEFPCLWSQGFWHYAAELRTLSVTYPLCCSALTDNTDNLHEMCPNKLTYFVCFVTSIIQGTPPISTNFKMQGILTYFFTF